MTWLLMNLMKKKESLELVGCDDKDRVAAIIKKKTCCYCGFLFHLSVMRLFHASLKVLSYLKL